MKKIAHNNSPMEKPTPKKSPMKKPTPKTSPMKKVAHKSALVKKSKADEVLAGRPNIKVVKKAILKATMLRRAREAGSKPKEQLLGTDRATKLLAAATSASARPLPAGKNEQKEFALLKRPAAEIDIEIDNVKNKKELGDEKPDWCGTQY